MYSVTGRQVHKCRVYKDRWTGNWIVHCYYSDRMIAGSDTWGQAVIKAGDHKYFYNKPPLFCN